MRLQSLLICIWALQVLAIPLKSTTQQQNAPQAMASTIRNKGPKTNVAPRLASSNVAPSAAPGAAPGIRTGKNARKEKRPSPKSLGHGPLVQQGQAHAAMLRYHRNKQQRKKDKKRGVFGKMLRGAAKIFTQHWLQKQKTRR